MAHTRRKLLTSCRRTVLSISLTARILRRHMPASGLSAGATPRCDTLAARMGACDERGLSAGMAIGGLFAQHAACSAASTRPRPPRARHACSSPADQARPRVAGASSSSQRSTPPEARFARCWLSPRRRFHVMLAAAGAETSRKCASSQLLMDLRRETVSVAPQPVRLAPRGRFVQACCVSVEVIRARVRVRGARRARACRFLVSSIVISV